MDSLFYSCPNLTTFQTLKFASDETNTEYFTYDGNTILFGKPDVKWNQICFVFDNESPLIYTKGKIFGDLNSIYETLTNYTTHTELSNIIGNLGNKVEAKEAIYYTQEEANAYNEEHGLQEDDNDFITTNIIKIPATEAIPYTNIIELIQDNELAVASALTDINDRLSNTYVNGIDEQTLNNIYEIITYDELAVATSLTDLNSRFSYTENINNKVSYLDENSTYDQYPSAKTMYDIITYNELAVATSLTDLNSRFSYTENINNKVSYLDENNTYIQYPSAKTMYDIITYNELAIATSLTDLNTRMANSEIIFNKVTYINNNSTDTQYPSAKAVYSYINEIFNLLNEEITYINGKLIELENSISGN